MRSLLFLALMAGVPAFAATCPKLHDIRREMDVVADNIVNANTTRTPDGGAYREKKRVCKDGVCKIKRIKNFKSVYEPEHPDADENGYVQYPGYSLQEQSDKMDRLVAEHEAALIACRSSK